MEMKLQSTIRHLFKPDYAKPQHFTNNPLPTQRAFICTVGCLYLHDRRSRVPFSSTGQNSYNSVCDVVEPVAAIDTDRTPASASSVDEDDFAPRDPYFISRRFRDDLSSAAVLVCRRILITPSSLCGGSLDEKLEHDACTKVQKNGLAGSVEART